MQWLENEVAVVTGSGSGIGRAVVARFVEEGAKVVAFDMSGERLAALKDEVGDSVAVVSGDVRSLVDNRRAVAAAVSEFGKLTVFVGNAGIHDAQAAACRSFRTKSWNRATRRCSGSTSRAISWAPRPPSPS